MNKKLVLVKNTNQKLYVGNLESLLKFVDKTFIINLVEREDRLKNSIKQLSFFGLQNYEIFEAIKPKFDEIDTRLYENYSKNLSYCYKKYVVGATGCKLSHLKIIKNAMEKNYDKIMILEDDFLFCENFNSQLFQFLKNLKDINWDMLYLGGNNRCLPISSYCIPTKIKNLYKCNEVKCTHAYILDSKLFPKIVKDLETYTAEIDNYYVTEIQPYYDCYICDPIIVKQVDSFSNITQINSKIF